VRRIVTKAKSPLKICGYVQFPLPGKVDKAKKKKKKMALTLYDVKMLEEYDAGELPATKEMVHEIKEAIGYEGSSRSAYRIFKTTAI
jgi:hypothetical protein